ncbi:MAG TPA: hypothetical protein VN919_02310 [Xanthobacteraceae bacterium]|nr:hypothetical protein [Xanthobacteraceae bacterium]
MKNRQSHRATQPRSRTTSPRAGGAGGDGALPAFFYRLAPRDQKVYLRSDAIDAFNLMAGPNTLPLAGALIAALEGGSVTATARAAQDLVTELCRLLRVRSVPIEVKGVRPRNARGELHGIFYPDAPRIVLWTRTALRHDVVKPKTFLRTLMHELAHYFDYALLRLGNSYHTRGFFKRESFLVRAVFPSDSSANQV